MPEKIAKIEEFNSSYNLENENNFDVSILNIENVWAVGIKKKKDLLIIIMKLLLLIN